MTRFQFPDRVVGAMTEADIDRVRDAAANTHAVRPSALHSESAMTGRALCDAIRIEAARDDRDELEAILAEDEAAMIEEHGEAALRRAVIGELWRGRAVTVAVWAAALASTGVFIWASLSGVVMLMTEALE